jgi:hypothetical protein
LSTRPHDVFSIPTTASFGVIRLTADDVGRALPPEAGVDLVLREALRLYHFGATTRSAVVEKRDFPQLSATLLAERAMHAVKTFGSRVLSELASSWASKRYLAALNKDAYGSAYVEGLVADYWGAQILVADVATLPSARKSEARVTKLDTFVRAALRARALVSLEPVLEEARRIERSTKVSLTRPFLGGSTTLSPGKLGDPALSFDGAHGAKLAIPGDGWLTTPQGELTGAYGLPATEIGLSEKLYFAGALDALLLGATPQPATSAYVWNTRLVRDELHAVVPEKERLFTDVHRCLDLVEDHFSCFVGAPSGERQARLRRLGLLGASERIGFAWGLWLMGLLRAVLVWFEAVALLLSIPWKRLYDDHAGILAAVLVERCFGIDTTTPNGLRASTYYPFLPHAPAPILPESRLDLLRALSVPPGLADATEILRTPSLPAELDVRPYLKAAILETPSISTHPVIGNEFYRHAAVQRNAFSERAVADAVTPGAHHVRHQRGPAQQRKAFLLADTSFAARLDTQLGLHTAGQLVRLLLSALDVPSPERQHLVVTHACQPWGGKMPPHKTHREGRSFDLDFPVRGANFDLEQWPVLAGSEKLADLSEADLRRLSRTQAWSKAKPDSLLRLPGAADRVVVRAYLRGFLVELVAGFFDWRNTANLDGRQGGLSADLAGTPFYPDIPTALAMHTAHLAIVLSCPSSIVWGSPLTHTNACYVIKKVFSGADAPLLEQLLPVGFAFYPHDHHNHWHIDYPKFGSVDALQTSIALARLLGVKYDGFASYLSECERRWKTNTTSTSLPPSALREALGNDRDATPRPELLRNLATTLRSTVVQAMAAYTPALSERWTPLIAASRAAQRLLAPTPLPSVYLLDDQLDKLGLDDDGTAPQAN